MLTGVVLITMSLLLLNPIMLGVSPTHCQHLLVWYSRTSSRCFLKVLSSLFSLACPSCSSSASVSPSGH